ncbi:hypothetical protein ACPOL_0648 [Acidisarcina polymorpha]|uniref:DUF4410 domain-containing protein n=2 Tax=Acidisarcina polymorpha TaxID=2211140 RepID=A0A2Z5FUI3_9BACT|nr:hypothetical protein ACPOL_0648 [Acidisarcina polymorpha]
MPERLFLRNHSIISQFEDHREQRRWVRMTAAFVILSFSGVAAANAQQNRPIADPSRNSVNARYIVGFDNVRKGTDGDLRYRGDEIVFAGGSTVEKIGRDQLVNVALGTERAEKGGTAGQVARFAIPYGGGAVLGAVSEKEVGILTLDFRDSRGGLHSAVFLMAKSDAFEASQTLQSNSVAVDAVQRPTGDCQSQAAVGAMGVTDIQAAPGITMPAEYRAIMYEHLLSLPEDKTHTSTLFRIGDASGRCAPLSLSLQIVGLSKGNAAVRASSGPIGLFAGVTSIRVRVTVTEQSGRVVFTSVEKGTRRGDKESLNAAVSVADKIGKDLRKAQEVYASR